MSKSKRPRALPDPIIPDERTVIGTVANPEAAVRRAVTTIGVVCPTCQPISDSKYMLDQMRVRVGDLPGTTGGLYMRIISCTKCGSFFDPFTFQWRPRKGLEPRR